MADTNLSAILDSPYEEPTPPVPIPTGTYSTIVVGLPRYDKSSQKQTPFVEFQHKVLEAGDDGDSEALAEARGDKALTEVTLKNTFYLTEDAKWRLDQFLKDLGFEVDGATSRRELIEQCAGKAVGVFVKHAPSKDGQRVFAQIDRTVALD